MAKHHNSQPQPRAPQQENKPLLVQEQASEPIRQAPQQQAPQPMPQQNAPQQESKRLYVVTGCDIDGLDGRLYREGDRVMLSPSSIPVNVRHLLRETPQGGK